MSAPRTPAELIAGLLEPSEEEWKGKRVHVRPGARVAVYKRSRGVHYEQIEEPLSFVCEGVSAPGERLESDFPRLWWTEGRVIRWARVEDVCAAPLGPRSRTSALAERESL